MNHKQITKRYLTPQQVEEIYGIPVGTQNNYRYLKRGPDFRKVGRRVYYEIQSVERFMRRNIVLTSESIPDEKKRDR